MGLCWGGDGVWGVMKCISGALGGLWGARGGVLGGVKSGVFGGGFGGVFWGGPETRNVQNVQNAQIRLGSSYPPRKNPPICLIISGPPPPKYPDFAPPNTPPVPHYVQKRYVKTFQQNLRI
jgi:hypothetical protein